MSNIGQAVERLNKSGIKKTIIYGVGIICAVVIFNIISALFLFTVSEPEQAVVKQFNEVVKVVVDRKTPELEKQIKDNPKFKNVAILEGKGLFFKLPWQSVEKYSSRLLTYDTDPREVTTLDKKKLVLDNYAQWEIENPALFSITVRTETAAHTRLDDIIYSKTNEEIGRVEAHKVISDKQYNESLAEETTSYTNQLVSQYGIKVFDVRIKKTNLPKENSDSIFSRMKTEREQEAKKYRSEGQEESQKIKSEADKEAVLIEAEAYEQAQTIKGEGDAEAARIYAEAYNRDPEFYAFYRTLQTYEKTLDGKTKLVIPSNSEFAKYLLGTK